MKPTFVLLFIFAGYASFGQVCTIVKVQGNVFYDNVLVSEGEKIADLRKLQASSRDAAVRILIPGEGSYPIGFASGQPIKVRTPKKESELYELTVQEYINRYKDSRKTLKTKGGEAFDWFAFFNIFSGLPVHSMLVIAGQKIPLQSIDFTTHKKYRLYACVYTNSDSVESELPIVLDSISFPASAFPQNSLFEWRVKLSYYDEAARRLNVTDETLQGTFFTKDELMNIITLFKDWKNNYNKKDEAITELYQFLTFNYGKFYEPAVDQLVLEEFSDNTK